MKKMKKGFTLVELLVVIAILAILGGITVVGFGGFKTIAEKQAASSELTDVKTHLQLRDEDFASYELTSEGIKFKKIEDQRAANAALNPAKAYNFVEEAGTDVEKYDAADVTAAIQAVIQQFIDDNAEDFADVDKTKFVCEFEKGQYTIVYNYSDTVYASWNTTGNKIVTGKR